MATKYYGSCTGSTGSKYDFYVTVAQNSQSISDNTSNVTVRLYLKRNDGYTASAYNLYENENNVKLYVGATKRVDKNLTIDTRNNATVQLCSWTGNVNHNSNGKLDLNISGSFSMSGTLLAGGSVSALFSCTDIPRASTLTFSAASLNPTQSVNMTVSRASSDFSHKITLSIGSYSHAITLSENVTTASFTVPQSWANAVNTSKKGTVAVKITTYNGTAAVGSKSYGITLNIPDNADYKPSFTVNLSPVSSTVPAAWSCYVKGKSKVRVSVSGISCKYSAAFSSLGITVAGVTKTDTVSDFELNGSGNTTVSVTVKDSRGIKKTVTNTVSVIDYSPVSCSVSKVYRCNSSGVADNDGEYLCIDFSTAFSSVNGNNICTKTLKYKRADEQSYVTLTPGSSPYVFGGNISSSSSYDVVLSVTDTLDSTGCTSIRHISSANIPFNIKKGGRGAAFGCFSETDNELTVAYNLNVKGSIVGEDITADITPYSNAVNELRGKMIKHGSLGIVFMNLRFKLCSQISAGTTVLSTIDNIAPDYSSPLSTNVTGQVAEATVYINPSGEFVLKTNETISPDAYVYVNGMFIY